MHVEERKEDEMKIEKTKSGKGKKNLRRNPSEYDKGKKRCSVEFRFGHDGGDDGRPYA
jgi:hypothetical protein